MIIDLSFQQGQPFNRDEVLGWFKAKYPLVKEGTIAAHLIRHSTNAKSRLHYSPKANGEDDLFFQIDGSTFRLYDAQYDPAPITASSISGGASQAAATPANSEDAAQFAYEHDLRDYLAKTCR